VTAAWGGVYGTRIAGDGSLKEISPIAFGCAVRRLLQLPCGNWPEESAPVDKDCLVGKFEPFDVAV
jgi:hypothetical protein